MTNGTEMATPNPFDGLGLYLWNDSPDDSGNELVQKIPILSPFGLGRYPWNSRSDDSSNELLQKIPTLNPFDGLGLCPWNSRPDDSGDEPRYQKTKQTNKQTKKQKQKTTGREVPDVYLTKVHGFQGEGGDFRNNSSTTLKS